MATPTPSLVTLRAKDSGKSKQFTPEHAERLLGYPNSQWEKLPDEKASKTAAKEETDGSTPAGSK